MARTLQSYFSTQVLGLGKAGRPDSSGLKAGGLCPHFLPTSRSLALWDLYMLAGRVYEAWACACQASGRGASGLLRIAPIMALLPSGQPCTSWVWAKGLADGPFIFPVTGTQQGAELRSSRLGVGGGPAAPPRSVAGIFGKRRPGEN